MTKHDGVYATGQLFKRQMRELNRLLRDRGDGQRLYDAWQRAVESGEWVGSREAFLPAWANFRRDYDDGTYRGADRKPKVQRGGRKPPPPPVTLKVPVTERALVQRINRALPRGMKLKIARKPARFYLVEAGVTVVDNADIDMLARELRAIKPYEAVAKPRQKPRRKWERKPITVRRRRGPD